MENKYFDLKTKGKDINIIAKENISMKDALTEFDEVITNNKDLFSGISKLNFIGNGEADYEILNKLQEKGIYINIIQNNRMNDMTMPLHVNETIRSGEKITHDGDVFLTGSVNSGGYIISTADIYILGTLRGTVHAGCSGDTTKSVYADKCEDFQVRIADKVLSFKNKKRKKISHVKFFIKNGELVMEPFNF